MSPRIRAALLALLVLVLGVGGGYAAFRLKVRGQPQRMNALGGGGTSLGGLVPNGFTPVTMYGARCDGVTDDSAAFQAATNALAGTGQALIVAGGTCVANGFNVTGTLSLVLSDGATLKHKGGASQSLIVFTGTFLRISGGTIDGNQASQTPPTYTINATIPSGSYVDIEGVNFVNTPNAAIFGQNFGGYLDVVRNRFSGMAQHDGVLGHETCAVNVNSAQTGGAKGSARFNHNILIGTATPSLAGGSPGGIFFAPTISVATGTGNYSSLEAIGNYFWGIGQNCGGNDIAPIHTYMLTDGVRVIGNYIEQSGFSGIAIKSARDALIQGNVIRNGLFSAQNSPVSGAIYYTIQTNVASGATTRVVIDGNTVDAPGGDGSTPAVKLNGISLIGTPTASVMDAVVSNNNLSGCGYNIWLDRVVDATITGNKIVGSTGGAALTEDGIEFNHVTGIVNVANNHVATPNGYGISATNVNSTATILATGNYVSAGGVAGLFLGVGSVFLKANVLSSSANALQVGTDGSSHTGVLGWDSSNTVVAGGISIDYPNVTAVQGVPTYAAAYRAAVIASDQSVTNSATLVIASNLGVAMGASETWDVQWDIYGTWAANDGSGNSAGIRIAVTGPTGATVSADVHGAQVSDDGFFTDTHTDTGGAGMNILFRLGSFAAGVVHVTARVRGDGTHSGNISLQFAQPVAQVVANTTIKAMSGMRAQRQ